MKLDPILFQVVTRRHFEQVEAIVYRLRLGVSKHRLALREELTWYYDYCLVRTPWRPLPNGKLHLYELTEDEEVERECLCAKTALIGKIGRWWSGAQVKGVPDEVKAVIRAGVLEERNGRESLQARFSGVGGVGARVGNST